MRKIKKINGFLVVRFNDREKRNYPDLGSFGVIDAEQYTGDIDFDRDAMEYTDADCIEVAVEQARGLESESDFSEEPPVCTVIVESDAECSEEEVEPQLMIAGWKQQLETQVESKHYPDIDAKAAAHELHGFKVALYRLGIIGKSETEVDPDHFEPNKLEELEPPSPTETEPDTFIHANKGIRSEWTVRKVYGLGLMLAQNCPPNDCKVYLNIFNMARELDDAIEKVGEYPAMVMRKALHDHIRELAEMYENNYAVQKFKEGMQP